jgi:succinate dehydrogenase / fumarate reductase cytochrome b subunit
VVIIRGGLPNSGRYSYTSNIRYTLQRVTGMVAFAFILWHVFHMHGWFHFQTWLESVAEPLQGARFKAYNAASSAATAIQGRATLESTETSVLIVLLYAIGVLACVYHLANGIWTMGITWGVWISPAAQRRANWCCALFGIALGAVGLAALLGFWTMDTDQLRQARQVEDRMYQSQLESGRIVPDTHKRTD